MRYRAIFDHLDDPVLICDLGGRILDANQRALSLTGYDRASLLGSAFSDLTAPPGRLLWTETIAAKLTPRQPLRGEYILRTAQGNIIPVGLVATCILVEGQATTVSLLLHDQRERESMQRELWSRGVRLQTILENAAEAIVATDIHGEIVEWNRGAVELFGYSREEALGRSIDMLIPREKTGESEDIRRRLMRGEVLRDYTTERLHKDGRKLAVAVSRSLIYSEAGEAIGTSSIMRDITERKRAEETLLRAQKMDSLGTMAGGIAHDFNNILGVILSFASALLMEDIKDPEVKEDLRVIVQSAERGADLARQLLTLSKPKDGNRERLELSVVVQFVEKILARIVDRRIVFATEIEHDLPAILGERSKIEQVLLNLCLNARDAMTEGGTIRLEAKKERVDEDTARSLGGRPGEYVVLRVADTGCGMDRETLSKIFDPYFTTKGRGRGTGLGLTMVYAIVQGHDGFLSVTSTVGVGSTFSVYLPSVRGASSLGTDPARAARSAPTGGTVLLIDDEEDLRRAGHRILGKHGYQVLTAADGEEALQMYQSRAGEIDLVLLDMVMPKLDGPAVFRRLRALDPEVKVILLSGFSPDGGLDELMNEGVLRFIKKPFGAELLLEEVRRAIEG